VARTSAALWRRPWLRATLTLSPPLAWFLVIYLASLIVMLVTAFWTVNPFTNNLQHGLSLANFRALFHAPIPTIIGRTVLMAALVTVADIIIAVPFAYFMARVASPRARNALFVAVLLPLWASYLARVYAWIVILTKDGTLDWATQHLGLGSPNIGYTNTAMWLVFTYIWLPFMIIPVYGALERIPDSLHRGLRPTSGRARGGHCAACCCRWRCRASSPDRSSRSHSRSGTSSRRELIGSGSNTNSSSATSSTTTSASANNLPFAAALARGPDRDHDPLSARSSRPRRLRGAVDGRTRHAGRFLSALGRRASCCSCSYRSRSIVVFAFDKSNIQSWPIRGVQHSTGSPSPGTTRR
jgi:hypothetical protein